MDDDKLTTTGGSSDHRQRKSLRIRKASTVSNRPHHEEMIPRMTIHGVMDFYQTKSYPWKFLWLIVLLTACGLACFEIARTILNYIHSPVSTAYSILPMTNEHHFPVLYLCPLNPFDKRKIPEDDQQQQYVVATLKQHFALGTTMLEESPFLSFINRRYNGTRRSRLQKRNGTVRITTLMSNSTLEKTDFVRECSFQRHSIACENITKKVFDYENGQCYIVDIGKAQQVNGFGLNLVLDIRRDLYHKDLRPPFDGVLMGLTGDHSPSGISSVTLLEPGGWTKIALHSRHYRLMNTKSSALNQPCHEETSGKYNYLNYDRYSKSTCYLDCSQNFSMTHCGCIIPVDESFLSTESIAKMCTLDQMEQCLLEIVISNSSQLTDCIQSKCLNPCKYWEHVKIMSNAKFTTIRKSGLTKNEGCRENNQSKRLCPEDTIILDIGYSDLMYTEVTQSPSMTVDTFISNIGGQVSLWMGVSVISVVQLSTFFVVFCMDKWENKRDGTATDL